MSRPLTVDVHIHLYPIEESAYWSLNSYAIWEYGEKPSLRFLSAAGLVEDVTSRIAAQDLDHGIVVNLFARDLFRGEAVAALNSALSEKERGAAIREIDANLGQMMTDFNGWLVDALQPLPKLTAFVGLDPGVLSPAENVHHLEDMVERGARGVKLHPVLQGFHPADQRMIPIYRTCVEADLTVLSHSGASQGATELAEPWAFAGVLREVPDLRLILAHLGGAKWRQTPEFAQAFPSVNFDLSEIVQWVDATGGPSRDELAELIMAIGPDRVMLGTDYPWYDIGSTREVLMDLPRLSEGQKDAIAGENAARILALPVS